MNREFAALLQKVQIREKSIELLLQDLAVKDPTAVPDMYECVQCGRAKPGYEVIIRDGVIACVLCVLAYFATQMADYRPDIVECSCGGFFKTGEVCRYCGGRGHRQPVAP